MAVTFDAGNIGSTASAASAIESSAFTVASNSNMCAVAGACAGNDPAQTITSVKFGGSGGTNMTENGSVYSVGLNRMHMWYLAAPSTGSQTLYATASGTADEIVVCGGVFYNVDQTTPCDAPVNNSGSNDTPTVDVSSATGEMVFDFVWGAPGVGYGITVDGSQTLIAEAEGVSGGSGGVVSGASYEAGAATVTMSWTMDYDGGWLIRGMALNEAAVGGRTTKNTDAWNLGVNVGMGWRMS